MKKLQLKIQLLSFMAICLSMSLFAQNDTTNDAFKLNGTTTYTSAGEKVVIGGSGVSNVNPNAELFVKRSMVVGSNMGQGTIIAPSFVNSRGLFVGNAGYIADKVTVGADNDLYILAKDELRFYVDEDGTNTEAMRIGASGKVGIGMTPPSWNSQFSIYEPWGGNNGTGLQIDGPIGNSSNVALREGGSDRVNLRYHAGIDEFQILVDSSGVLVPSLTFNDQGQVSIGHSSASTASSFPTDATYNLAVKEKMIAEEVKVRTLANWPDYVFTPAYELTPLEELEIQIEDLGHLPNIPSAEEVASEGILLGEMNAMLLEKVEELTLHLIDMNKEIQTLKKELDK